MPPVDVMNVLQKDIFFIAPEIVLMVWGLLVVLVDVGLVRKMSPDARRDRIGMLSLLGVGLALVAAAIVCLVPLFIRGDPSSRRAHLDQSGIRGLLAGPRPDHFLWHDRR